MKKTKVQSIRREVEMAVRREIAIGRCKPELANKLFKRLMRNAKDAYNKLPHNQRAEFQVI